MTPNRRPFGIRSLTALILSLLLLSGCARQPQKPQKQEQPSVSSQEETMTSVAALQTAVCRLADGSMDWHVSCTYDDRGNLTLAAMSGSDGLVLQKAEFTYDERGNILKLTEQDVLEETVYTYSAYGKRLTMEQGMTRTEYTYDIRGNLLIQEEFQSDILTGHVKYLYDKAGRLLRRQEYDSEGHAVSSVHYTYDDMGNLLEEREYDSIGIPPKVIQYTYDEMGNCLSRTSYLQSGTMEERREFSYDAQGNCLSVLCYDGRMEVLWWIEYRYQQVQVPEKNAAVFYENRRELFGF